MKRQVLISAILFAAIIIMIASCKQKETQKETSNEVKNTSKDVVEEEKDNKAPDSSKTSAAAKSTNIPLRLIVDNLKTSSGEVEIGVYTPKNKFPDENDQFKRYRFKPKNGKIDELITDLPYGVLAFAIYHDENNSKKIDKNLVGIPKEPYAFSNNIKPTVKAPSFDDCKFNYSKTEHNVKISLL